MPVSASLPLEAIRCFRPGSQILVTIGMQDEQGSYILAVEQKVKQDTGAIKFDQEFKQLNYVLTNHTPHVKNKHDKREEPSIEEKMETWIGKAEKCLSQLRKNRGKRLSEQFYNNKR